MTPEQFAYWLHGYFEIVAPNNHDANLDLTSDQVKVIREHLNKVFNRTPFTLNDFREYHPTIVGEHATFPPEFSLMYNGIPHSC